MLGYSSRKGHAYSQLHVFRSLPKLTQILLLFMFGLSLYGFVNLFPEDPFAGETVIAETNGNVAAAVEGGEASNVAAVNNEEYRQQLLTLSQKNEELRRQVQQKEVLLQQAASAAASQNNNQGYQEPTSLSVTSNTKLPDGVKNYGVFKPNERGSPLGPFNWEGLAIEPNSTQRRFWIKTATNEEGHHFYRRILVQNGWIETADPNHKHCYFQFYGRFVPNIHSEFKVFKEGKNMINHIPGEFAVLNKEPFLKYMRETSLANGCDYTQVHPESYLVHEPQDCFDLFKFGDQPNNKYVSTLQSQEERDNSYFFWKPPFNSFGRGIKVVTLTSIREQFGFGSDLQKQPNPNALVRERCTELATNLTDTKAKLLVQRAVDKPYRIKGTKFDFRAYILIANTKPYVTYFKFGHVRRCLRKFEVSSPVKKAHVCNDYSDELENDDFPLDDHIWGYDKFKEYLLSLGYTEAEVEKGFVTNLKKLFLGTFMNFKDAIPKKNGYWILLGLDIAIDENWNVRVLEVNTNPSMHFGTKIWGDKIVGRNWRQMNEMLELVWDSHLKSKHLPNSRNELIFKTKYGFELLYSEAVSPPYMFSTDQCFKQDPQMRHPPKARAQMEG